MIREIDAKGLACPKPVILTKKELDSMEGGSVRTVVDNVTARENLSKLAGSMGLEFSVEELGGTVFAVTILKSGEKEEERDEDIIIQKPDGGMVLVIQSDQMGKGDEELGKLLMKSFIYTVNETKPHPKAILFYNGGVKLTVKDSPVLDDLQDLLDAGVEIISCGTCLDFYNLKDSLAVGDISNMYTIYEKMQSGTNTITIG
ncbi:sulfurtransferase-like selenium metabolism protein YedF [Gudongella sp. SC589]|jgi:selenium metabolism protein YedF|uniref:sulfurtransferase-like selenium metabolism protein YedF n=1 Tax=Gudongella sp. SC589 TaxID=3385990 RepID=UPI0039049D74